MKINKLVLIIGIVFLFAPLSWSQEPESEEPAGRFLYLSLNEALQLALRNNFDVQFAFYDRLIKETDIDKAKSIYDTVFTMTADYDYDRSEKTSGIFGRSSHTANVGAQLSKKLVTGTDLNIDFQNTRNSTDTASLFSSLNPYYESSLQMKFTQPFLRNFFGMGDWGEVLITKIDVHNFNSETLDRIERELADVEKAYWDLTVSQNLVEIRQEMFEKTFNFYLINEKRKELGTAELTDLLAAEANMELRRTELEVEESNFKTAINKLKLMINHPENNMGILPIDEMSLVAEEISLERSLKTAFTNRRDYERAKKDIKAKKIKFNIKKNARWPQLDLEGSLKLNGIERVYKNAAADAFSYDNPEYYAKATFSFPFEDRESRSGYSKAKGEKAKALLNLKKVEKTIVTDIDDKTRMVNVYKGRALSSMNIEELQRKKLEEEEKKYGYGRSSSDLIIRFQEDYLNARILALKALNDFKNSLIDLYLAENIYFEKRSLAAQ